CRGQRIKESSLLRYLKAIAGSTNRFQITGVLRILLDFFPQLSDIHINGSGADVSGFRPNGIKDPVAGEHATRMSSQVMEQTELSCGGGNNRPPDRECHGICVN